MTIMQYCNICHASILVRVGDFSSSAAQYLLSLIYWGKEVREFPSEI